jgi:hypothetical protein
VEKIISVDDVDKLSEKIISAGHEFKITKYFEVILSIYNCLPITIMSFRDFFGLQETKMN